MPITDEIGEVIEFAEAYKGPGWRAGTIDTFRYKDTGEILWSIYMGNTRPFDGPGETVDRLLISRKDGAFQARSAQMNRWSAQHYRRKRAYKPAQEGA